MEKSKKNQKLIKTPDEIKASLKYFRVSPRKTRLVTEMVKGLPVNIAVKQLMFIRKRSGPALLKLLKSAASNAKVNFNINQENLYIKEFKVDEAPMFKRNMPRARGRASIIRKRRSHVAIVLAELKNNLKAKKIIS